MTTGTIGRRLLRFAGVLALAGVAVGCASPQQGATVAPPGFGKDPASRAERLVSYCDRLADKGELVTALGLCARAQEIEPGNPDTLMRIAAILDKLDRKQAAAQTYEVLLDENPDHHEARYSLGKLYMETGESSLAALHFNRAIKKNPEDPRVYNALGIIRDQAGEHEAAQALYRTGLGFDSTNHSLRNNLGLSLALSGQREEAIEVLAALAVDPEVDRTVLRNLEAAYAARPLPASGADSGATADDGEMVQPMEPQPLKPTPAGAMAPEPAGEPLPEAQPVKTEVLDVPSTPKGLSTPKQAPATPAPLVPAAEGAPTPLYVPRPSTAGEPQQTGDRQPVDPSSSVVLAAAEQLMERPDWADFEPGALMEAEPPADVGPGDELPPQSGELGEISVDPMDLGAMFQPGETTLSMLLVDTAAASA